MVFDILGIVLVCVLLLAVEIFYLAPALSYWISLFQMRKLKKRLDGGVPDVASLFQTAKK